MGRAARKLGKPDAAAAIVDDLLAWLGVPSDNAAGPGRPDPVEAGGGDEPEREESQSFARPARRKPKVTRAAVRLRQVTPSLDVAR